MNYFRGQIVLVLPDFRARISKLTVALAYLRADIECGTVSLRDLVVRRTIGAYSGGSNTWCSCFEEPLGCDCSYYRGVCARHVVGQRS